MAMDLKIDVTYNPRLAADVMKLASEVLEQAAETEELLREDLMEVREKVRGLECAGRLAAERIARLEGDLERKAGMTIVLMADLKRRTVERDSWQRRADGAETILAEMLRSTLFCSSWPEQQKAMLAHFSTLDCGSTILGGGQPMEVSDGR